METEPDANQVFTALWIGQLTAVRLFIRRRCPAEMVDDVLAETFTIAWRHLDAIPQDARVWLLGCARRVIHTQLRTRDRYLAVERRISSLPDETVAGTDDAAIARATIRQAWGRLSEDDREVLALYAWDELDSTEASKVLGCTPLAFRARLSRARKRLKALIDVDARQVPAQTMATPQPRRMWQGDAR